MPETNENKMSQQTDIKKKQMEGHFGTENQDSQNKKLNEWAQ